MDINDSFKNRSDLKSYFVKNAIPTQSNFAELIDSVLNQRDDGLVKAPGTPLSIEASGDASSQKKVINLFSDISDDKPRWVLSLNPRSVPAKPESARAGFGIGDADGASRLFIDQVTGRLGVGTVDPADTLDVSGSLRVLSGSNPLRITDKWSGFPDAATNQAEISNDTGTYKTLMIVGNKSAGGNVRRVSIWDKLTVNGELEVTGAQSFGTSTRQMINLYASGYGIGVQTSTAYFRSDANFAWFKGGSHDNAALNAGTRGVVQMVLKDGNLGIGTTAPGKGLHIQQGSIGAPMLSETRRPGIALTGQYPELTLFSRINNVNHGATIRLGSYDADTGDATKHWVIGTSGRNSTFLDFGFSANNNGNPHYGIRNYAGKTVLTLLENGNVGIGNVNPAEKLHVEGLIKATGGINIEGNLSAHVEADGSFYRLGGQVYICVDDNLYIRDARRGIKFHFDTNAGILRQDNWSGVAFRNGWVNYGHGYNSAGFFKDRMGIVHLKGMIKTGAIGKEAFILPAGYRPAARELICTLSNTGPGRLDVLTNGYVYPLSGGNSWFTLDSITFRAA